MDLISLMREEARREEERKKKEAEAAAATGADEGEASGAGDRTSEDTGSNEDNGGDGE